MKKITTPLSPQELSRLKSGDEVLLSGTIFTARDQAHIRLVEALNKGKRLPFDLSGAVVYYCGPTGRPKGKVIGACGPTTSSRMDEFAPALIKRGLKGMIGKGRRSPEVAAAIKKYKAVYFLTHAGCGALLAKHVLKAVPVAYADLGPEAVLKLTVKDFPLIVGMDSRGGNVYGKA